MNKNSHDLSHHRMTTYPMGYLVPTFTHVLLPGDVVNISRVVDVIRLDPFTFPIMDTIHACHEWFFVPFHQLWEGWERFLTQLVTDAPSVGVNTMLSQTMNSLPFIPYAWNFSSSVESCPLVAPYGNPTTTQGFADLTQSEMQYFRILWGAPPSAFTDQGYYFNQVANYSTGLFTQFGIIPPTSANVVLTPSSTLPVGGVDVTSLRRPSGPSDSASITSRGKINALPFLAYQKIIDDKYRDQEMEYSSVDWPIDFYKHSTAIGTQTANTNVRANFPIFANGMINPTYWSRARRLPRVDPGSGGTSVNGSGAAGDSCFLLRRANWANDYLTTRRPAPQRGAAQSIVIGADGMFSIDELREATADQNIALAKQRSGGTLAGYYATFFGETSPDLTSLSVDFIGRDVQGLDVTDIYQTSATPSEPSAGDTPQGNPVGYSRTISDSGRLKYHARSMGILMRLSCIKPQTTYHYGIDPLFTYTADVDYFNPKREAIGWQPVPRSHVFPVNLGLTTPPATTISGSTFNGVTGWLPPYESFRRKLSYTCSGFNPVYGDLDFASRTFARDFSGIDGGANTADVGIISAPFRRCDPTNAPFAIATDAPTQIQHYMEYYFHLSSVVPHAINLRCLTH